jgi:hydrogenase maturation protein HypF
MDKAFHITVTGLVQGVGFRPFVYRIAQKHHLTGWVRNTNDCVEIFAQGPDHLIVDFLDELRSNPPSASHVRDIEFHENPLSESPDFRIIGSLNRFETITEISPDIAVCKNCLEDMEHQENRIKYPFVNCTNCGPRFTIINNLPYDRKNSSMNVFPMCESCLKEYEDVEDRRFHAQPVACSDCGPHYTLFTGNDRIEDFERILSFTAESIMNGGIIAMKGMGGYHLACDATNEEAVQRLRLLKNREGKPLAVMFRDGHELLRHAAMSEVSEHSLFTRKRPIVIIRTTMRSRLAPGVSVGLNTVGAMFPYLPFHYLLFNKLKTPAIVLTSGNISDEPILIDDKKAIDTFLSRTDGVLTYNREIENRTDDSVVRDIGMSERVFRRSRGFVPSPVNLKMNVDGILATGAELVNTFCIGKGRQAILSQYIGDLQNAETIAFYEETLEKFQKLFRMKPSVIACDLHPDYFTSRYAEARAGSLKVIKVQHHHAHIASCMAEHGVDGSVLGVAMDGTGYGTDGNTWGAEFMYCDFEDFERFTHFKYVPLPGGDKGVEEPWRMAVSYLYKVFGDDLFRLDLPFLDKIEKDKVDIIIKMIKLGINCPLVSSAGRLFDAVSAMLGLCLYSTFSAEAPMRLESIIDPDCSGRYEHTIGETVDFDPMIREIVQDISKSVTPGVISAKFHNTLIDVIVRVVILMRKKYGCRKVVLSGGTFQNEYLLAEVEEKLKEEGFKVFSHHSVPTNDGGIALGQLAIAATRVAGELVKW